MTTSLACAAVVPSGDEADARLGSTTRAQVPRAAIELKRPLLPRPGTAIASVGAKPAIGALAATPALRAGDRRGGTGGTGVATVRAKPAPAGGAEAQAVARAPGDGEVGVLGVVATAAPGPPPPPEPEPEPEIGPPPLPRPVTGFWPSEAQWAALRRCESSGRYDIVDRSGTYRGAYQFDRPTWASVGGTGDPAAAPPAEQDFRARLLYARRGPQPWPVCGRFLR